MKNLKVVSFVGVDEQTDLDALASFESDIDCEWSVLYSDSKSEEKHTRYPSYDFCKKFIDNKGDNRPYIRSLHLCGSVIDRYLKQETDVMKLCENTLRIQLNLNIKNYPDYDKLSDNILEVLAKHHHKIILQENKTKEKFMQCFLSKQNPGMSINLLRDSSGGFGREITKVTAPDDKYVTGYAGGINPTNVARIVKLIDDSNLNNRPYYIDMESGVRENNVFSIEKCKQVINNLL